MLNQQDQQAISYAQTAIMQDIQSKQNINPLRQAFTAQWTPNSQYAQIALQLVLDWATYLSTNQRIPMQTAILQSVSVVMPIIVAQYAVSSGFMQNLPPEGQQLVNQLLSQGNEMDRCIGQMYGQPVQPQTQVQPGWGQRPAQPQQMQSWPQNQQMDTRAFGGAQPMQAMTMGAVANATPNWTRPGAAIDAFGSGSAAVNPNAPQWDEPAKPVIPAHAVTTVERTPASTGPVDQGIRGKTAMKRDWTLDAPYPRVFDPRFYTLHYRRDGDIVIEYLKERTNMDYAVLETRKLNPNAHVADAEEGVVVTTWQHLARTEPESVMVMSPQHPNDVAVDIPADKIPYYGDAAVSFTQAAAELKLYAKHNTPDDIAWEMTYNNPLIIDTVSNQIGFMEKIVKNNSVQDILNGLTDQMYQHSSKDARGRTIWTGDGLGLGGWLRLDRYIAWIINRCLRINANIDYVSIDNFTEDWPELLNLLTDRCGAAFTDMFVKQAGEYLASQLKPVRGKELKELMTQYDLTEYADSFATRTLVLYGLMHVTYLPFTAASMNIDWEGTPGVIHASEMPEFHAAIDGIYHRAMARNPGNRVIIRTEDYVLLEISKAWLGNESYLISVYEA